jgi:hypothetical protein
MKEGGKGGGHTITGLRFERGTDLATALASVEGFKVVGRDVLFREKPVGKIYSKNKLYSELLPNLEIDYKNILSKKLLPDDACFAYKSRIFTVIEKKYQQVAGSVDEKLQTCDFKKKQYERLFSGKGITVQYCYVLSEWFKDPSYRDTLSYIQSVGCHYYFEEIPIALLGLT